VALFGGFNGTYLADTWVFGPVAPPNRPPVADAGPDPTFECTGDLQAIVTLDGSWSSDPDSTPGTNDDIVEFTWSEGGAPLAAGARVSVSLGLGLHDVTLTVTDKAGATSSDHVLVTVADTVPPVVTVAADPASLWPPNHRMRPVRFTVHAADVCDPAPVVLLESVVSSEPDDAPGAGDGLTTRDIQGASIGAPDFEVLLRAERDGRGPGRTYSAWYRARDGSGNVGIGAGAANVPHDWRGKG
jgi:hypothetical protein